MMKYTYGYIKEAVLAKMDLSNDDANDLGLLNKIPFYANEALSQITSGIKPNQKYAIFDVQDEAKFVRGLTRKYKLDRTDFLSNDQILDSQLSPRWNRAREEYRSHNYVGRPCDMPSDFIGWNQQRVYRAIPADNGCSIINEVVTTAQYNTYGFNQMIFLEPGTYHVPYNASWFQFTPSTPDVVELNIPADIVEAIPSYIASQLFKIDDEQKSSIYRNEFEMALSRIDDNMASTNVVFKNGSDW